VGVESCTAHEVAASASAFKVYASPYTGTTGPSTLEYQWKALLPVEANTQYCYRVFLGSLDLLGGDATPQFWSQIPGGSTQSFSFAVLGDWGYVQPDGTNTHQAAILSLLASKNPRFIVSVGDNVYATTGFLNVPSATQYGDLYQTGPSTSAAFGPNFWKVIGSKIPFFPAVGNHGFAVNDNVGNPNPHTHIQFFPQDTAVALSGGRYQKDTLQGLDGTAPADYPSTWYAFDAGIVRIYILTAVWADNNAGTGSMYQDDYDYHWAPNSPQFTWLKNDLAAHPDRLKFAVFHNPLYSDVSPTRTDSSDTYLQGQASLEGLLHQYGTVIGFNGHAHSYERNIAPNPNSLITYIVGTSGAEVSPVGLAQKQCSSFDAYSIGWSLTTGLGSACGSATVPTQIEQVFHFLMVKINGSQVTVTPYNELGNKFDEQVYNFAPVQTFPNKLFLPVLVR
jgi:hypothetical protein